MDRKEFCELLVKAREQSGKSVSDISFEMKMLFSTLRRFEKGEHSFKTDKIFKYVEIIGYRLVIKAQNQTEICESYKSMINFIVKERTGKFSQRKLGEAAHISFQTIVKAELFETVMSIDTLLKILDVLNCTITIEPKQ